MIGRGVESKSGGSVFLFEGAREIGKKPRRRRCSLGRDGVTLVNQKGDRIGTSRSRRRASERETSEFYRKCKKERKRKTGNREKDGDIFPPLGFSGRAKTWRGMRATFLLFIVSRCLCFTRPCHAVLCHGTR